MTNKKLKPIGRGLSGVRAFRGALLRGLAVLCPPLLTLLIVIWVVNTTKSYFLQPVTGWARDGLVWCLTDVQDNVTELVPDTKNGTIGKRNYHQISDDEWIPKDVFDYVQRHQGTSQPKTGAEYYKRYVDLKYLQPHFAIPIFLGVFLLLLYLLGRFMAAGIGVFFANAFDRLVLRLPGVRAVYSAAKQVSDFIFTQREIQVTRIVAVEFPRTGVWSIGFVTGEGLLSVSDAAQEPMLTVLIPYSPVPVTGCTIIVRKSETIDLDITFDQACQFIVSCGVVVPPQQLNEMKEKDGL